MAFNPDQLLDMEARTGVKNADIDDFIRKVGVWVVGLRGGAGLDHLLLALRVASKTGHGGAGRDQGPEGRHDRRSGAHRDRGTRDA